MRNLHARNTVRYYVLLVVLLLFLFFSNDFGLLDVQKTAIVTSVGIDRDESGFIITSQIAIPQSSKQGKSTESVQIVSRGKTVAQAFEDVNAKTGWYPKLVFCNLIVLGEKACQQNVFDGLEYFLLDEYLTDNCQVVACDGLAKDILNTAPLVDQSSGAAIIKILSPHAARVGTVLPSTLHEFAIGYFGDSASGYLPLVQSAPQQEEIGTEQIPSPNGGQGGQSGQGGSSGGSGASSGQGSQGKTQGDKPVFTAEETALFVKGRRVGKLTAEETFAYNAVKKELQLAPYSVSDGEHVCTLNVKQSAPKIDLKVSENGQARLQIKLAMTAGVLDYAKAQPLEKIQDVGDIPSGVFSAAEKKLSGEISSLFEKTKALNCDLFGVRDLLVKHEKRKLRPFADTLLSNTQALVTVRFKNVR
ncbi:MAG: hypothetical protein IJX49_04945 [Clostridia bacterium]|nr:hypothetical protein [Clostridia bacterium]